MNLNDLRAAAYQNASKSDGAPRTIKPFSPPKIAKNAEEHTTKLPVSKNTASENEKPLFAGVNRTD